MNKIKELETRIQMAKARMYKFPDDEELRFACEWRIEQSLREIAELEKKS